MKIIPGTEGSPELGINIRFGEHPGVLIEIDKGDTPSELVERIMPLAASGLRTRSRHSANACQVSISINVIWPWRNNPHGNETEIKDAIRAQVIGYGGRCDDTGNAIVAYPPKKNGWRALIRAYDKRKGGKG